MPINGVRTISTQSYCLYGKAKWLPVLLMCRWQETMYLCDFDRYAHARASACRSNRLHEKTVHRRSVTPRRVNHRHKDPYGNETGDVFFFFFQLLVVKNYSISFSDHFAGRIRVHISAFRNTWVSRTRTLLSERFTRLTVDVGNIPRLPI